MTTYYPEGHILNSAKGRRAFGNTAALWDAVATGEILEQTANLCDAQHNLVVDLGGIRGIIPREEGAMGIAEGRVRDIALISRVGKPVCFTVQNILTGPGGTQAVLSRRAAQERCFNEYIRHLRPGAVIPARVTHLENFGAFCDIGCGLVALLPIDAISVSRISHPGDRFYPGEEIRAVVRSIDPQGRITLSCKELLGTWEENAACFSQGETVSGTVRSVEKYGVFVELAPNLAGLAEPRGNVAVGDRASVYIKSLLPEKMKVKLIIIDTFAEENVRVPLRYYYTEPNITYWQYSPESCPRKVFSEFI